MSLRPRHPHRRRRRRVPVTFPLRRAFALALGALAFLSAPRAAAQAYTAGQTYFGAKDYIEYQAGDLPIVLSAPHGGDLRPRDIPDRANGVSYDGVVYNDLVTAADLNTEDLARKVADEIYTRTGHRPHLIVNHLHRIKLDPNREIGPAAVGNADAEQAWREYHAFIAAARASAVAASGFNFLVDLHGHAHPEPRLELGYNLASADLAVADASLDIPGVLWDTSLRTLPFLRPAVPLSRVLRGPRSIGDFMTTLGFPAAPSPQDPHPTTPFFQGGYTTRTHTCWTDNGFDHGLQIECNYDNVRDTAPHRTSFAQALTQTLNAFLFDNYGFTLGAAPVYRLTAPSPTALVLQAGGPATTLVVSRSGHGTPKEDIALAYGGTAVRGTDFNAPTSVSFAAGQTSATLTLTPLAATGAATDKTLTVQLDPVIPQTADTTPLALALGRGSTPIVRIAALDPLVNESSGSVRFKLTRTSSSGALTVNLLWAGSAVVRRHYLVPATLAAGATFSSGQSELILTVPLIDDAIPEPSRQLTLTLAPGAGYLVGASATASAQIDDNDRPPGLDLWLAAGPQDERIRDESGANRYAIALPAGRAAASIAAPIGTGIAFNGAFQAALVPRFVPDPRQAFTLAFRFRMSSSSTTNQNLLSFGPRGAAGSLHVYLGASNTLRTWLNNSSGSLAATDLDVSGTWTDNAWHHYLLIADPSLGRRVYIDGSLRKTAAGWSGSLSADELFWLGWRAQASAAGTGYFSGALADVRSYQRALSPAEVSALASGQLTFSAWLAEQGLPGTATPADDPDVDGWAHALEYALGSNPTLASSTPQVEISSSDTGTQFTFVRRLGLADVALALQSAPSPDGPWTTLATLAPGASVWNAASSVTASDVDGVVMLLVDRSNPLSRSWRLRADVGLASASRVFTPPAAPVFVTQPANQTASPGGEVTFRVEVSAEPPPSYQWFKDGIIIPGATSATLTLSNLQPSDRGDYTVTVTNVHGTVTSTAAKLVLSDETEPPPANYLANLSVRAALTTKQPLIVGFVIDGQAKPILLRAVGPGLASAGVENFTADPRLDLYDTSSPAPIAANDNWSSALLPLFTQLGASALAEGSKDAALVQTLNLQHTVHANTIADGIALVEAYDAGENDGRRLVNLSARYRVGTGDDILIAGFVIGGAGTKDVLIRGVGPGLLGQGVANALADPYIRIYNGKGDKIAENDNWDSSLAATFSKVGAFALTPGSKDAATVLKLEAGIYTIHVSGEGATTGEALVEIYDLQ